MKLTRTFLIALTIVGMFAAISLQPTDAEALTVQYAGVTSGNYGYFQQDGSTYYAGFYNLSVENGEQTVLGMCDDFSTHVPSGRWEASLYTSDDIVQGAGRWAGDLEAYNVMGYLFMKTYSATSGSQLADINAAIWNVTHGGLNLTGNALSLYNEAIGETDFTGWYGKMNILTPGLLADGSYASQEYLVQAPVPEPATLLLLGTGLLGIAGIGRKKVHR